MIDKNKLLLNLGKTPFEQLVRVMEILRSPEGCSWDREQTHQSLLPYLIEETYEVVEVIESGKFEHLAEELGDMLCQIIFHSQIGHESGEFDINDAIRHILDKLIRRHPHVFGDRKDLTPEQVRDQWEQIKSHSVEKRMVLGGLPKTMPALTTAFRIGEKAKGVGFDWKNMREALKKVHEELEEIEFELEKKRDGWKERAAEEIGDLLFAVSSVSRHLGSDPESALRTALEKFRRRFDALEKRVKENGGNFANFDIEGLESIWQEIKKEEGSKAR